MSLRGNGKMELDVQTMPLAYALALARPQAKLKAPKPSENVKIVVMSPGAIEKEKASKPKAVAVPGWTLSGGVLRSPSEQVP